MIFPLHWICVLSSSIVLWPLIIWISNLISIFALEKMKYIFPFLCLLAYAEINPYGAQGRIEQDPQEKKNVFFKLKGGFLALMQFQRRYHLDYPQWGLQGNTLRQGCQSVWKFHFLQHHLFLSSLSYFSLISFPSSFSSFLEKHFEQNISHSNMW